MSNPPNPYQPPANLPTLEGEGLQKIRVTQWPLILGVLIIVLGLFGLVAGFELAVGNLYHLDSYGPGTPAPLFWLELFNSGVWIATGWLIWKRRWISRRIGLAAVGLSFFAVTGWGFIFWHDSIEHSEKYRRKLEASKAMSEPAIESSIKEFNHVAVMFILAMTTLLCLKPALLLWWLQRWRIRREMSLWRTLSAEEMYDIPIYKRPRWARIPERNGKPHEDAW